MSSQAEANLSALIESTDDLIWAVDLDHRLIAFNTSLCQHMEAAFGVRPTLGMSPKDVVPPESVELLAPLYSRAFAKGSFQTEFFLADGRTLELTLNPILVEGKATGVSVFGKDITERKAVEKALRDAERSYRDIFNGAIEGMFRTTLQGRSLLTNPALARMLGYASPEEVAALVKDSAHDIWVDPEERERFLRLLDERGVVAGFECQFRRKDGSTIWVSLNCRTVLAEDGISTINEGFIEDITEPRQAAQALADSEGRLRSFFAENASVMLLVEPANGIIHAANRAASKYYGYALDQLIGMSIARINALPSEEVAQERDRAICEERSFFQFRHRLADGQVRDVEVYSSPIHIEGTQLLLSIVHDVTGRIRAEQKLRESAESLHEAQRIAGLGSYVLDIPTGTWTSSEILDEIFGIGREYQRSLPGWTVLIHPSEQATMTAYFAEEVLGKKQPFNKEYRIVRQTDREERWVHGLGRLEFGTQGQPLRMRGTIQDITARKRAELQLRASEEQYRATFEQAAIGIVHTGRDGKLLRCNARFAAMLGYLPEEMPGLTVEQITVPEDAPGRMQFIRQIWSGELATACLEKRYLRKDGSTTWARVTVSMQRDGEGRPLHSIALVEDINVQKAAEERLCATQEALRESETRYRTAFQTSQDGICISRLSDGRFIDVNKAYLDMMGYEREEMIGRTSLELNFWVEPELRQDIALRLSRKPYIRDQLTRYRRKDGQLIWVLISASVIEIEDVSCILSLVRDITESKAAEERLSATQEALTESEARYRAAFQTSHNAVNINRLEDGMYFDVNNTFLEITGYEREEVVGRTSLELEIWADKSERARMAEALRRDGTFRDEIQFRKKNGEVFWGLMSASLFEHAGVACVLSVTQDITNAKAAQDEIRSLAFYDPLTGLPNRRLFEDRLRQALSASSRHRYKQALLFVDLDNFKNLNDTLGHQTGDLLLQESAIRLRLCVRETDTVARLGGDEFLIILEDLSQIPEDAAAKAETVAKKVLASLEQPYWLDGRQCLSSASIGITIFGDRRETPNEVMQQADIAMYQAKAAGRNTFRLFAPALQTAVVARATLEDELRRGIKANEFVLFYQPQVDRNCLIGAEALLHWNHPRRGLLSPDEFISLAEATGLIVPLGNWVLETACARIAAWGKRGQGTSISINISARQFREPDFVQEVVSALDRTGASPHRLTLELTESLLLDDAEETIAKMQALKLLGVRLSLDDFGTGYSSLSYLKRLPLDQLKIDRSFVRDLMVDICSGAIVQAVISLGRAMGLSVVAEGVETEEQRDCLAKQGCHAYQGFLFSRPLPVEEFQRLWLGTAETAALGVG